MMVEVAEKESKKIQTIQPHLWADHLGHAELPCVGAIQDVADQYPVLDGR